MKKVIKFTENVYTTQIKSELYAKILRHAYKIERERARECVMEMKRNHDSLQRERESI